MSKFSVIVPIYKVEKYVRKCIESILNQTFSDFELILVDDGSPDNCPAICDEYAMADKRIKVIHKKNGGLVSARNSGVIRATGEYICYVDGDDWIKKDLLETVYEKGIKDKNPDMIIFGAIRQFENHQIEIPSGAAEGVYNKERLNAEVYPYMMYDNRKPFCSGLVFPVAWNKIYRNNLLKEHYCQEEQIKMGEDNAFIFECLYFSECVVFLNDYLYIYNQLNSNSFIHSYDPNRFENNQLLMGYIEKKLGGKNRTLDSQINAFKAYWLIMAVFHEVKSGRKIGEARRHIKSEIKVTDVLRGIKLNGIPKSAIIYLLLLKYHFYTVALLGAIIKNMASK